jgi:parallel beta-helix repeat protein
MVKKRGKIKLGVYLIAIFIFSIVLISAVDDISNIEDFVTASSGGVLQITPILNVGDYLLNVAGNSIITTWSIPVTSCIDITSPGNYILGAPISNSNPGINNGCINIDSSDVVFDCQGNWIDGQDVGNGIRVQGSSGISLVNVTIKNCNINDFKNGIFIEYLDQSIIESSSVNSSYETGIYISRSDNNIITDIVSKNNPSDLFGRGGISITYSTYNNITNSDFNNNHNGIVLQQGSEYNNIFNSNISSNPYGIVTTKAIENYIYNNIFNNIENIETDSEYLNYFNIQSDCSQRNIIGEVCLSGNYWANPTGTGISQNCADNDDNTVCDGAYQIDATSIDNYPLTYRTKSIEIPISILNFPEDERGSQNGEVDFTCTAGDNTNIESITLYIWDSTDNIVKNTVATTSGTLTSENFFHTFTAEDDYTWNCLVEDSDGNIDWSTNRTIYFEQTPPVVSISYPRDGDTYTSFVTQLDFSATDEHLKKCWYNLDDYLGNIEVTCNQPITGVESINGWYNWTVYAEDLSGNIGSASIEIETDAPTDLRVSASRTECIAPCGVFFDATATKGLLENDYVNPHFTWDFGDSSSGKWKPTKKSKNKAYGFIASHVYENPGIYSVNVNLKDTQGNEYNDNTIQINVLEKPSGDWDTVCISREGNFEGCPAGATEKQTTSATDVTDAINNAEDNSKILFRRGDVWSIETYTDGVEPIFNIAGESIEIGAYGEGEKPKIYHMNDPNGHESLFQILGATDIRIRDIELGAEHNTGWNVLIYLYSTSDHSLISNITFNGTYRIGIRLYSPNTFIVDSDFLLADYLAIYGPAPKSSVMGNTFSYPDPTVNPKNGIRFAYATGDPNHPGKTIFSNNFAFRDWAWALRAYNGPLIASDNIMNGTGSMSTLRAVCHECDPGTNTALIERNVFYSPREYETSPSQAIGMGSKDIGVIRNNIFYNVLSGKISLSYVPMDQNPGPGNYGNVSDKLYVYHNTLYNNDNMNGNGIHIRTEANLIEVKNNIIYSMGEDDQYHSLFIIENFTIIKDLRLDNNLWYSPAMLETGLINGDDLTPTEWTNNFGISQNKLCDLNGNGVCDDYNPEFLSTNPASPNFMRIDDLGPAYNSGADVPVFEDYNNNPRPYESGWDIGAYEYTADMSPPYFTKISNITIGTNTTLSTTIEADDDIAIDGFLINDTTNFAITYAGGLLTNATRLNIGIYNINISVNDTSGKSASEKIWVNVLENASFSPSNNITSLYCGDGICNNEESHSSCPEDCEEETIIGRIKNALSNIFSNTGADADGLGGKVYRGFFILLVILIIILSIIVSFLLIRKILYYWIDYVGDEDIIAEDAEIAQ